MNYNFLDVSRLNFLYGKFEIFFAMSFEKIIIFITLKLIGLNKI
jgi:hypothetical protein